MAIMKERVMLMTEIIIAMVRKVGLPGSPVTGLGEGAMLGEWHVGLSALKELGMMKDVD